MQPEISQSDCAIAAKDLENRPVCAAFGGPFRRYVLDARDEDLTASGPVPYLVCCSGNSTDLESIAVIAGAYTLMCSSQTVTKERIIE